MSLSWRAMSKHVSHRSSITHSMAKEACTLIFFLFLTFVLLAVKFVIWDRNELWSVVYSRNQLIGTGEKSHDCKATAIRGKHKILFIYFLFIYLFIKTYLYRVKTSLPIVYFLYVPCFKHICQISTRGEL